MTRTTNARLAGAAFLLYIVAGLSTLAMFGRATGSGAIAARLANIPQHLTELRASMIVGFVASLCAFIVATTLYALTRDEDREIALFGFAFRVGEGIVGIFPATTLGLLWLSAASAPGALDDTAANTIGAFLLEYGGWQASTSALLFSFGSLAFAWLFLRGAMIPRVLARLGVVASVLLVILLPLQMAGWVGGTAMMAVMWLPMLVFELILAFWLIIRGAALPRGVETVH